MSSTANIFDDFVMHVSPPEEPEETEEREEEEIVKVDKDLSPEQQLAVNKIRDFLDSDEQFFGLFGYAGTGKTFCIQRVFGDGHPYGYVAMTAPTHKAVGVLAAMADRMGLSSIDFATIHSLLGCRKVRDDGEIAFKPNPLIEQPIKGYDVIIIDECSMLGVEMWGWVKDAILNTDSKVIVMGDPAQLPPVGEESSPTFDLPHAKLSTIMRSQGVIQAAGTQVRENIMSRVAPVAEPASDEHGTIEHLEPEEWLARLLERADTAKALAFTNDAVDWVNDWIRTQKFGEHAQPFEVGERLVAIESFEVGPTMIHTESEMLVTKTQIVTRLGLECWKLGVQIEGASYTIYVLDDTQKPAFLRSLANAKAKGKALGKSAWNDYYNLIEGFARVRPGWATTIHKSQGSTYDEVFLLQTDVLRSAGRDHAFRNMLLYVGYSRARKGLYLS